jgi:CO/xanthine dehydrogenase FAD-binding subunit
VVGTRRAPPRTNHDAPRIFVHREAFESAGAAAAAACDPASDQRGSAAYERAMAALWTTRALETLLALTD